MFMEFVCSNENSEALGPSSSDQNSALTAEVLRKLVETSGIGFAIWDDQLRCIYVNQALTGLNRVPAALSLADIFGKASSEVEIALRQAFTTRNRVPNLELVAKLPTRTEAAHWIVSCFPVEETKSKAKQVGTVVVELPVSSEPQGTTPDGIHESQYRAEELLELSTSLMSNLEAEEVVAAISEFVRKAVRHDFASIALFDQGVQCLRVHTLESPLAQELAAGAPVVRTSEAPYGPTFLRGEVRILNRASLMVGDSLLFRQLLQAGIQSLCCLPLIARRGTLGTLNLGRKEDNAFSSHDVTFLKQVAAQVALVLDNASAYREIRELTEKLNKEKLYLQDEVRSGNGFEDIVGGSPALQRVLEQVNTVAPSDATVLILGETGTGKELIARAIHRLSSRKDANFIKLNCAAIPTGLLESELFGHEKGAFTGAISQKIGRLELADKGTLFLDEVGEIPLELQPKLLRVLQDQEFERLGGNRTIKVDIRLIAATNRDLAKSVNEHEFRSDLFYRLHVFPVRLPPLRERGRDIELLVRYFVEKFAKRMHKQIEAIPSEALRALQSWMWPGNVRELENFIERSVILTQGTTLSVPLAELRAEQGVHHDTTLEGLERKHILRVLRETGGVIAGMHGAAARLGMKRTTLQSRMQKLGITREEYQN
jgi:formate hydrogenlyase transcriptional activator